MNNFIKINVICRMFHKTDIVVKKYYFLHFKTKWLDNKQGLLWPRPVWWWKENLSIDAIFYFPRILRTSLFIIRYLRFPPNELFLRNKILPSLNGSIASFCGNFGEFAPDLKGLMYLSRFGHVAWTCSMNTLHGHSARIWSIDIQFNISKTGSMTCSNMDHWHGQAERAVIREMQQGHGAGKGSKDMQHGNTTCAIVHAA
jgi:hypothetical protein